MKKPQAAAPSEELMTRRDVENLVNISRRLADRLRRLREAYITGDTTPLCTSDLVRAAVGLPEEAKQ